jgi:hypothetical protein
LLPGQRFVSFVFSAGDVKDSQITLRRQRGNHYPPHRKVTTEMEQVERRLIVQTGRGGRVLTVGSIREPTSGFLRRVFLMGEPRGE